MTMKIKALLSVLAVGVSAFAFASAAAAADSEACKKVRFSDVGWTDITATTSTASVILEALGYEPDVQLLSVPVTYASLKNKDIDVFLGNWMPTMENDIKPYREDGSVETLGANLEGAKYTLAVPKYTYDAGLKDFADIAKFKDKLGNKIYGIEPGNDGNRLILDMITNNKFELSGFELVESSEQGMLAQVMKSVPDKQDIVFLGWEPHPMNANIEMAYLSGGDDVFGPNFGGATVYTNVRKGYVAGKGKGGACNASPTSPNTNALGRDSAFPYAGGRVGNGQWDFETYWANNFGGPRPNGWSNANLPSRYEVYRYEIENGLVGQAAVAGKAAGEKGGPACYSGGTVTDSPDRRVIIGAIVDCGDLNVHGSSGGPLPVRAFGKFFLTEPVPKNPDPDAGTIFAELIGLAEPGTDKDIVRDIVQLYR